MAEVDARIATAVWRLAQQREMSLKDLAENLELPYRSVQNYLTGKVKIPAQFIERCCELFMIEADFLLFGQVGIDVVCIEDAINSVLGRIIPRLELDGERVFVGSEGKSPLSERSQFHHDAAIVGEIAMAIQREYERLRADAARAHGRGNIYARRRAVEAGTASPNWHD